MGPRPRGLGWKDGPTDGRTDPFWAAVSYSKRAWNRVVYVENVDYVTQMRIITEAVGPKNCVS